MPTNSEKTSPEQQAILDHLQAQSNLLRSQTFSTPTAQVSLDQALESAHTLKGKVVVITGAAGIGFGANAAKKMAKFGFVQALSYRLSPDAPTHEIVNRHRAKVVLSDLKLEAVQEVVDEIRAAGG